MIEITDQLADIRARVAAALERAGRSDDVTIVAVSKGQPAQAVRDAFLAGQTRFGESYVQEAAEKMPRLSDLAIEWHYIGRIQANKTRFIAERFDWVHTVDRAKLVRRLAAQRPYHAPPLNLLIEVNQGGEGQKAGARPDEVDALARLAASEPRLALRGLMSIPPDRASVEETAAFFEDLARLGGELRAKGHRIDTLSMGMSRDFEIAIAAGSNCVRIGTAIFGQRPV